MNTISLKNTGITQTIINSDNNNPSVSEIQWNANYDGENAIIKINTMDNGKEHKYKLRLDNNDLAKILSIPSVNMPIDKRLEQELFVKNHHIDVPPSQSISKYDDVINNIRYIRNGINLDVQERLPNLNTNQLSLSTPNHSVNKVEYIIVQPITRKPRTRKPRTRKPITRKPRTRKPRTRKSNK
jgi:hypothetical protein